MGRIVHLLMVICSRIRISVHFSTALSIGEWGILEDLLAFLTQSPVTFYETW